MRRLLRYLLQGLLLLTPIFITLFVVVGLFQYIDSFTNGILEQLFDIRLPGLGFLVLLIFLILVGFLGSTFLFKPLFEGIGKFFKRIPVINLIYTALQDVFAALMNDEKRFQQPVLVKLSDASSMYKMGFITQDDLSSLGLEGMVAVYLPHSYNFSGNMFLVPAHYIRPLPLSSAQAMKFIVSGGMTHLEEITVPEKPESVGDAPNPFVHS